MIKIPSFAFVIFALNGGSAFAVNLMLDFGATTAGSSYLTLSPAHSDNKIPGGETSWNTITSGTSSPTLKYSDGTTASGVVLSLGQESTGGNNIINLASGGSLLVLEGNGGGTAGQQKLLTTGSIYGDSTSTAVGRDALFGSGTATGTGAAVGMSLTGLAAGTYQVYVMARNTSSDLTSYPMKIYAGAGAASGTFDFTALAVTNESNVGYASLTYGDQYSHFVNGENYVAVTVTLAAGQALFLAVDGGNDAVDRRGFLNMVQVVQIPEPTACVLLGGGCFLFAFRRRR